MYARNYIPTNKQNPDNLRKLAPTNLDDYIEWRWTP